MANLRHPLPLQHSNVGRNIYVLEIIVAKQRVITWMILPCFFQDLLIFFFFFLFMKPTKEKKEVEEIVSPLSSSS